ARRPRQLLRELDQHGDAGAVVRRSGVPGVVVRTDQERRTLAREPADHVLAGARLHRGVHPYRGDRLAHPGLRDQLAPVALTDADRRNLAEPALWIGDGADLDQVVGRVADVDQAESAAGDRLPVLGAAVVGDVPLDQDDLPGHVAAVVVSR